LAGLLVALAQPALGSKWLSDFEAPDSSYPYTCTFHWFNLDDGSTIGLDVIRSDASSKPGQANIRGLRVFHIPKGAEAQAPRRLVFAAPSSRWQSSFGGDRPVLPDSGKTPFIARGRGWIMASVSLPELGEPVEPGQISSAAFDLDVDPEPGVEPRLDGDLLNDTSGFGSLVLWLEASDYVRVRTRGRFVLDGVEHAVIDSLGPASVHFGEFLPDYGYVVVVPGTAGTTGSNLLVSTVHGDAFKIERPADTAFTYAYGDSKLPIRSVRITGRPKNDVIPIGLGRKIVLSGVAPSVHRLLGVETWTATARAKFVETLFPWEWFKPKVVDIGTVILDFRGEYFVQAVRK
jgi:hypothetical protein